MKNKIIESVIVAITTTFILKLFERYGNMEMLKYFYHAFVIELWPIWIGLVVGLLWWFIRFQYGLWRSSQRLDDWVREIRQIKDNVNNHYKQHS